MGSAPEAGGGCSLGTIWAERESDCVAGWSRDGAPGPSGATATFIRTEACPNANDPGGLLHMTVSGRALMITSSDGTANPSYAGEMSSDCASASGTYGSSAGPWSATIAVGSGTAMGGGCVLGRVWRETEADCIAVWTSQ